MKIIRLTAIILLLTIIFTATGCDFLAEVEKGMEEQTGYREEEKTSVPKQDEEKETNTPKPDKTKTPTLGGKLLKSHYIDVGQGDSIFIELPDGKCMLIDAGERGQGDTVCSYISRLDYKKIDYVVVTHAHTDHMGSMADVIRNFKIGNFYMPKAGANSKTYENLLDTIAEKGLKIKTAKAGVTVAENDLYTINIIAPVTQKTDNLNNSSAVVHIKYGKKSFLYMGDAEKESEYEITADVTCDVIKVGHHGSTSSSSCDLIYRTGAEYAVICCGTGNSYGHPHDETLEKWNLAGAYVYRTDICGNIVISSDGKNIKVENENRISVRAGKKIADTKWILNTKTKKVHYSTCEDAKKINPNNAKTSDEALEKLIAQGYTLCKSCEPR